MLIFYSRYLSPGDLCFDVGANFGNRVKIFLKRGAKVIAIEPQERCIRTLNMAFRNNPNLVTIPKALGKVTGQSKIFISNATVLSSLSEDWIKAVKTSGRFKKTHWGSGKRVNLTTLDELIHSYGLPKFIKIDVEGYEFEVIQGLSYPVKTLSLEYTPEYSESIFNCLDYLLTIGPYKCNFVFGESFKLHMRKWISSNGMKKFLKKYEGNVKIFGDVYIQFSSAL